jgi:hypothetical protein
VRERILQLSREYTRWGRDKLAVLLKREGMRISGSTVGREMSKLKARGLLLEPENVRRAKLARKRRRKPRYATRMPRGYRVQAPGDLVQVDTLRVSLLPDEKRFHFSAWDKLTRLVGMKAYKRQTSTAAADFLYHLKTKFPFPRKAIQIDGGSESMDQFEEACQRVGILLFQNPPAQPELNGGVERSNRTHREEFYEVQDVSLNLEEHNQQLPLFQGEGYWYPGTLTLFDNIYHLLPNHYLDIISGKAHRYWPRKVLTSISMSECLPIVSEILSNIIEGASHRFNLAFVISCGLDSRTLFSTTRKVANKIKYFSFSSNNADKLSPDAEIPAKMLRDLRLEHDIISPSTDTDRELFEVFKTTIFTARQKKVKQALSFHNYFKKENKEFLVISGDFSDITKRSRMRFSKMPKALINGSTLAAMARMPSADLAKKEFSKWLVSTKTLTKFNINILDLMHWEQRMANWGAKTLWEHEIIHESLCPFTCRSYIEFMLRVPLKFRTNPDYKLYNAIIAANWPEVLNYDINPSGNKIKKTLKNFLYKTNLYDPIQFLNIWLIKRFKSKDLI